MVDEEKIIDSTTTGSGTLFDYFQNILNNQQDMPSEFQKVVNDNFWDLLYKDKK